MTGTPRIPCGSTSLPADVSGAAAVDDGKAALRRQLRAARAAPDAATRVQWDAQIGAQVVAWWRQRQPAVLGVYWPLAGEPDLRAAYAELAAAGARLALPVVQARAAPLVFAPWMPGDALVPDAVGVLAPSGAPLADLPAALLVPCLGFDADAYRLGYGGGFYDRTLAARPRPATLGVAYACQQARFAHGAHDVPLDAIVTERSALR